MPSRRETLVLVAAGAAAVGAGWALGPQFRPGLDLADVASPLMPLHDLDGRPRSLLEWRGQVLVCNFWATWCPPCREEIPELGRIRATMSAKNVEIVGIAIDQASNVVGFMKQTLIVYPVVLAEAGALESMRRLGNSSGALPFTVVFDRSGAVAHRRLGVIAGAELERQLSMLAG